MAAKTNGLLEACQSALDILTGLKSTHVSAGISKGGDIITIGHKLRAAIAESETDSAPVVPTVHLNGTNGVDLLDQYCKAMRAINDAIQALPCPHGRDYYPQGGDATQKAIEQRHEWQRTLQGVFDQVDHIATKISDQVQAR
jgi:hypothetical protein